MKKRWEFLKRPLFVPSSSFFPFFSSGVVLSLLGIRVIRWHRGFGILDLIFFIFLAVCSFNWWCDILSETELGGCGISSDFGFRLGFLIFIRSEVLFFFSFFWTFFHSLYRPRAWDDLDGIWPPLDFSSVVVDPVRVPMLKTIILLCSGFSVTALDAWYECGWTFRLFTYFITIFLGCFFMGVQFLEYEASEFSFRVGVFRSIFFLLTGFHGFHVFVGIRALTVSMIRYFFFNLSSKFHSGHELAAWYWHFVDVVWLFLFTFVYWVGF